MLSCNEVTWLCASEQLRRAPLARRVATRLHLLMCKHCSRYVRELRSIGAALRHEFRWRSPDHVELEALEPAILKRLRSEPSEGPER